MEKSKDEFIEKEPFRWDYSKLMDTVYLSLCRKENVIGAIEASSFNSLYPDSELRAKKETELGNRFDDEMIHMATCLMALNQRSVILDMGEDTGINNDNEFYWEEQLQKRIKRLKRTKALSRGLTFDIVKAPIDSYGDGRSLDVGDLEAKKPAVGTDEEQVFAHVAFAA